MKSYFSYFKLRFITNLTYRLDAIAGICTQIFFGLIFIMVYVAFYESGGNPPMSWNSLANYIWLQQAFYALIYPFERDEELLNAIRNGDLAYELIRPQNFYFKFYIKMVSKKIVSVLLRFLPVIIFAFSLPYPFNMSLPNSLECFIIFLISMVLATLLITALNLLIHVLTMFTLDEKGTMITYSVLAEIFMGGTVPIPFFPKWLRKIANVLPFRFVSDLPFRIYSGNISTTEGYTLLIGSLIWIIIIIFIGYKISEKSLKKAVIQGG